MRDSLADKVQHDLATSSEPLQIIHVYKDSLETDVSNIKNTESDKIYVVNQTEESQNVRKRVENLFSEYNDEGQINQLISSGETRNHQNFKEAQILYTDSLDIKDSTLKIKGF